MTRADLVDFERNYARLLRREASRRRKRYPAAAAQLDRWAEASDRRVEAIRVGPLFEAPEAV